MGTVYGYLGLPTKTGYTSEAVKRLSTIAATQMTAITSKVDTLAKSCNQDFLERKIEELSGQLINLTQRSHQQQKLLDKILEKASTPPTPQVQALATPGP